MVFPEQGRNHVASLAVIPDVLQSAENYFRGHCRSFSLKRTVESHLQQKERGKTIVTNHVQPIGIPKAEMISELQAHYQYQNVRVILPNLYLTG